MQQLKEKLEKLEIEKAEWTQAKSSMEAEVAQVSIFKFITIISLLTICQVDRYKENLANFRKQYSDLGNRSRATLNSKAAEIKELTAERDALKAQLESKAPAAEQSSVLTTRIDTLMAEKAQLETSFAEEKARLEKTIESERAKAATAAATAVSITGVNVKGISQSPYCYTGQFIAADERFYSTECIGWESRGCYSSCIGRFQVCVGRGEISTDEGAGRGC